jgi:DNA ligase-4
LRAQQLEDIVARAACLGHTRVSELRRLQGHGGTDFASAAQQVLSATDDFSNPPRSLTLEEVDQTLDRMASLCSFSSSKLRESVKISYADAIDGLVRVFRRLPSMGVKWMIRLLSKNLRPADVPVTVALRAFHFLLPALLSVRTSLSDAVQLLEGDVISQLPVSPPSSLEKPLREAARTEIEPRIGTMIGLQAFDKARSIQHCCQLAGRKEVSVERKYDGEYCQVHVSLTNSQDHLTIFSKSGRDSTVDRVGLHNAIKKCLGLGTSSCRFTRQCVLVGELLVWNERMGQIMPFYKIRRYVSREGRQLGCARDSPPCEDEHLMIVFYDVLLLDNILCLHEPLHMRRRRLETLISREAGQADIGEGVKIDLRHTDSASRLHNEMTSAIAKGWEGLVVKDWNAPYVSLGGDIHQIKLKKDYIPGWGDSTDLVVIGGRRDATEVLMLGDNGLSWTTFYLGCLTNKDAVTHSEVKPTFQIVGTVSRPCLGIADLHYLNDYGRLCQVPFGQRVPGMDLQTRSAPSDLPTELFTKPAVVEVVGAGFDRPPNERFLTLRFPRILKVHRDRTYADSTDFAEYQRQAKQSTLYLKEDSQHRKAELSDQVAITKTTRPSDGPTSPAICDRDFCGPDSGPSRGLDSKPNLIHKKSRAVTKKRERSVEQHSNPATLYKKPKRTKISDKDKIGSEKITKGPPSTAGVTLKVVEDQQNRDCEMISNISSPPLCDKSLRDIFADPGTDLLRTCWRCPLEITSNRDAFLDRVKLQVKKKAAAVGQGSIPYIVLVYWPSTSDVLDGI